MSLDIWLENEKGMEVVSQNITHNLREMWSACNVYDSLYQSNGKRAYEVLDNLKKGSQMMKDNPAYFKEFNASNSWGLYKQAVPWLDELIIGFEKHPDAVIGICK